MASEEKVDELWREITALDRQYSRLERSANAIAKEKGADSPEAQEAARQLKELGSRLLKLYGQRAGRLKKDSWESRGGEPPL